MSDRKRGILVSILNKLIEIKLNKTCPLNRVKTLYEQVYQYGEECEWRTNLNSNVDIIREITGMLKNGQIRRRLHLGISHIANYICSAEGICFDAVVHWCKIASGIVLFHEFDTSLKLDKVKATFESLLLDGMERIEDNIVSEKIPKIEQMDPNLHWWWYALLEEK